MLGAKALGLLGPLLGLWASKASFASAGKYDTGLATQYVYLSGATYCDPATIESWKCNYCIAPLEGSVTLVQNLTTHSQGFLGYSGGKIILAFRGTVEKYLRDWIEDLSFGRTVGYREECPNCAVHSGFLATYSSLKAQIVSAISFMKAKYGADTPLAITGHSLGAAMAQLASLDLTLDGWGPVQEVYTFGQPRVGNQAYIDFYKTVMPSEIFRVTHWRDTVPHLPPEHLLGYVHGPREVFYVEDMSTFRVCDGSGEDPACSDQHNVDLSIDDHLHYLTYVNSSEIFPISLCEPLGGTDSMPM